MNLYQERLQEVIAQYSNGNANLGFRMLLDVILDTEDLPYYQRCIALMEWKDAHANDAQALHEQVMLLIRDLQAESHHFGTERKLLIVAEGIEKSYGKKSFTLGPISFSIHSGELVGLVGENGNGKTTLLRILASDLHATQGSISYPQLSSKGDAYEQRTVLTYIPQRTPKWHGSVKDNLKLTATHYGIAPHINESLVLMWMIRFGLWEFRNYTWDELSSGYKMRFELARTFLRRPQLLLLDEPLANLDILSQQLILEDLKLLGKSLRHPLAIMLSSQQLYEVEKVSDEVLFLKNGKPSSFNHLKDKQDEQSLLVIELEIENSKEELIQSLGESKIQNMQLLGSNYYVELSGITSKDVLHQLAAHGIEVKYFRNISTSTRRFFNQ